MATMAGAEEAAPPKPSEGAIDRPRGGLAPRFKPGPSGRGRSTRKVPRSLRLILRRARVHMVGAVGPGRRATRRPTAAMMLD